MNLKMIICFVFFVFITDIASADCYFGCDSISRNLSTDYAKLSRVFERSGFSAKKDQNSNTMCKINDKNELEVLYVEKNTKDNVLIVGYSQFSPPKTVGSAKWEKMPPSLWNVTKIQKTLNFGIIGIKDSLSEDQRCVGGVIEGSIGESGAVVCVYDEYEDLPVTLERLRREMSIYGFLAISSADICK